ncbi:GNAT family protein [Nocardiopsis sp. NPDC007018]|uniref:GNAT family N-acetyltransferase n=1 Tax=Nocardiopsis sp. NPDC007018 TaxID=3155721 RepID=UPI0033D279AA
MRPDLVERYWRWEQEIPTIVGYNRRTPQPLQVTQHILVDGYDRASDHELRFTIYDLTGQEPTPVGIAKVYTDQPRGNGEYVVAMGEGRGRGVGSEATWLVLDYAFHVTNLRCVYLTVLEPNTGAIRAYEKAGFKRQGVRRNSNRWLGETVNEVLMDAIPEEFEGTSLVKQQLFG